MRDRRRPVPHHVRTQVEITFLVEDGGMCTCCDLETWAALGRKRLSSRLVSLTATPASPIPSGIILLLLGVALIEHMPILTVVYLVVRPVRGVRRAARGLYGAAGGAVLILTPATFPRHTHVPHHRVGTSTRSSD